MAGGVNNFLGYADIAEDVLYTAQGIKAKLQIDATTGQTGNQDGVYNIPNTGDL